MSIPTSRNVSSSPHQEKNLTFGEFLAKRALYSKTPFVKRDVVGGESLNSPLMNAFIQPLHVICNNYRAGHRAGGGSCEFSIDGASRMKLKCYRWPREGAGGPATTSEICPADTECVPFPARNLLGNEAQFTICLPRAPIDEPQLWGQPPEQPGQPPEQSGREPDFYGGSNNPIPYNADEGTYDLFVQAPEGQNLAFIYPPRPDTNYFGSSWSCIDCPSGNLAMYHQQTTTFAFTYFSPSW